jgi:hypothetical protein
MREHHWPGIATAVAILWIVSTVLWLGIAGPIWQATGSSNPDPWIGFAGNVLGAAVSIIAAVVAGIAAYRTIVPMQHQLAELVRQNQFAQYERLRARAGELKDELRLVFRVNADLEIVEKVLEESGLGARERLNAAIDRSCEGINLLWTASRNIWGDSEAQQHRKDYVESSLRAAATSLDPRSSDQSKMAWLNLKTTTFSAGVVVHARIELELQILSEEIAFLEPVILGRPRGFPFPFLKNARSEQPWRGDLGGHK